jgi:hypothetical protein
VRRPRKDRGRPKKLRKNPAHGFQIPKEMFTATANLAVMGALHGATFAERMLVATLIPSFLGSIRKSVKPEDIERFADVICEPGCKSEFPEV